MNTPFAKKRNSRFTTTQLASGAATCLALSAPLAGANTVFVTSCADSGAGTLRQSVTPAAANNGDTIDITACSVISLTTGEIAITQPNLTLHGAPSGVTVKYTGAGHGRIFNHSGLGTLRLENVTVGLGYVYAQAGGNVSGGCINSSGSVYLANSAAIDCKARTTGQFDHANGGGIYAADKLDLRNSVISGCTAHAGAGGSGGGGAWATGDMTVINSTISGNSALGDGFGGGLYGKGDIVVEYSTVSGNYAWSNGGGVKARTGGILAIANSTISGNSTVYGGGGVHASDTDVTVQNSTIAFNTAVKGKVNPTEYSAPGLAVVTYTKAITVNLRSTILSNNAYGPTENDFSKQPHNAHVITTNGNNNLIRAAFTSLPPSGLITGVCPLLGALRNNGGPTWTHALLSHSPAIDTGNNNYNVPGKSMPAVYDQRGAVYPRVSAPPSSPSPRADLGAYEVQQDDILFDADFEGCP